MANDVAPLTDAERAELEMLRAEKARREEEARNQAERAELERLRQESALQDSSSHGVRRRTPDEEDVRVAKARERGRALMEPGDDLAMPLGQKLVLAAVAIIVLAILATVVFGHR